MTKTSVVKNYFSNTDYKSGTHSTHGTAIAKFPKNSSSLFWDVAETWEGGTGIITLQIGMAPSSFGGFG